jgi:hypothetical protein
MKVYRVTYIKYYNAEVEIEAENEEQAIELAKTASFPNGEVEETFLECDSYEAELIED